jgi:uncharacterized membrane-anchored protein
MSIDMRVIKAGLAASLLLTVPAMADVPPPPVDQKAATDTAEPSETVAPAEADAPVAVVPPEAVDALLAADPREAIAKSLVQRDGTIDLQGGQARVTIAEGFAFLDPADTKKLLTDLWGNPPDASEGVLGAIVPRDVSVLSDGSWVAIITYVNEGHVSDDDASSINYDDLLKQMQEETTAANDERVKAGYEPISLVGWAQKPSYDGASHKLHWAKHLQFGTSSNTLNYSIRALGRTGVLELNVVGDMKQLPDINAQVPKMLTMVSFSEGNRYADFKEGDQTAAYGVAALIAGGAAAKAGLFKGLIALLLASWKFIAIGAVAVGGMIWRMFSNRKEPSA